MLLGLLSELLSLFIALKLGVEHLSELLKALRALIQRGEVGERAALLGLLSGDLLIKGDRLIELMEALIIEASGAMQHLKAHLGVERGVLAGVVAQMRSETVPGVEVGSEAVKLSQEPLITKALGGGREVALKGRLCVR